MIKLSLLISLFLVSSSNFPEVSATQMHEEHGERQIQHPCGDSSSDLHGLTGFFRYKGQAEFRDLNDRAGQIWLRHHGLEDTEITIVRLFKSRKQPTVAVVHGRRFVNYMDEEKTKPLVDMFCVVKVQDSHVLQYPMQRIEEILNSVDHEADI